MSLFEGSNVGSPSSGPNDYEPQPEVKKSGESSSTWQVWLLIALVAGAVGYFVWHHLQDAGESVSRIRHYPARFDGQTVLIRGRVGEAFPMGGSWAFYLHQGRDTIVVFSRTRTPLKNTSVAVRGSISVGYLDGQPRPALFESGP